MPEANALAVRKSITVNAQPERAFEVFTSNIGDWWPLKTHSISGDRTASVMMETRLGGRLYETDAEDAEHEWGVITIWEPPHHLAFTWAVRRGPENEQKIEVTFTADDSGTRIDLVHTGWEKLGDEAPGSMKNYDEGWDFVLGQYIAKANA